MEAAPRRPPFFGGGLREKNCASGKKYVRSGNMIYRMRDEGYVRREKTGAYGNVLPDDGTCATDAGQKDAAYGI